ncbi:MAG: hypothetical protein KME43_10165 [Myxacorys chilensis ATA2-1-KO14]|nr:hypothetical protein [Myxacorys chilensis ATA2-1-KO14]
MSDWAYGTVSLRGSLVRAALIDGSGNWSLTDTERLEGEQERADRTEVPSTSCSESVAVGHNDRTSFADHRII